MTIHIIGITGKARAGKDTIADYLVENRNFVKISFAHPIKMMLCTMLGIALEDLDYQKDQHVPGLATPRYMLQTLGTDWGRKMISPQIWIQLVKQHIEYLEKQGVPGIVISDCRFNNEAAFILGAGGEIWEVFRDVSPVSTHESEDGINPSLISTRFNNCEDISDLQESVEEELMNRGI